MLSTKNEVLVEKIDIPGNLRSGQPFEAVVVTITPTMLKRSKQQEN